MNKSIREQLENLYLAGFVKDAKRGRKLLEEILSSFKRVREERTEEINMGIRGLGGQWEGQTIEWRNGNKEAFRKIVNYIEKLVKDK